MAVGMEDYIAICATFIATLLSIALPLLLQSISSLDEKYNSTHLVELVNRIPEKNRFISTLIISVISIGVFYLHIPAFKFLKDNNLTNNIFKSFIIFTSLPLLFLLFVQFISFKFSFLKLSIKAWSILFYTFFILIISILVLYFIVLSSSKNYFQVISGTNYLFTGVTTILLIFSFLALVNKLFIFNTPEKLVDYLIIKLESEEISGNSTYLLSLGDILVFCVKRQNILLGRKISSTIHTTFYKFRQENINIPVRYPDNYYALIYSITLSLIDFKKSQLTFLIPTTVGGIWLFGEFESYRIHNFTYQNLWRNLKVAIENERDDMVMSYWKTANQYSWTNLTPITVKPIYNEEKNDYEISNQLEVSMRENDILQFKEFHYALGGLALYSNRSKLIGRFFKHTQSDPPKYELLPSSMNDIFKMFFFFHDIHFRFIPFISLKYSFPNIEGLHGDYDIKEWVCKYIVLLFLRQYSLTSYFGINHLSLPNIPTSQSEKRIWINNLAYFKRLAEELYYNEQLKIEVGLQFLTDDWCQKNKRLAPLVFIEEVKRKTEEAYNVKKINSDLSEVKIQEFNRSTAEILVSTYNEINSIKNPTKIDVNYNSWYIVGVIRNLIPKDAFSSETETDFLNINTIFSEIITDIFCKKISLTFLLSRTKSYLFNPENIFQAMDKLGINFQEYIIVNFGIEFKYVFDKLNIDGLSEISYKGAKILKIDKFNHTVAADSLFLLKEADLPDFIFLKEREEQISKYDLGLVNEDYKIYTSILDLSVNDIIRLEEEAKEDNKEDLLSSALVCISSIAEIRWKKFTQVFHFKVNLAYPDYCTPNSLDDVEELH